MTEIYQKTLWLPNSHDDNVIDQEGAKIGPCTKCGSPEIHNVEIIEPEESVLHLITSKSQRNRGTIS